MVQVKYTSSRAVEVVSNTDFELFIREHPEYSRVEISPDKTAIKNAIESGEVIPGCAIVERQNMQIK
jgi:hypothetical protein